MKNTVEFIKAALAMTKSAISRRTPPVFATSVDAYTKLGKAIETVKSLSPENAVPAAFATSIGEVIDSLEAFRSGYISNNPAQKTDRLVMSTDSVNMQKAAIKTLSAAAFEQHVLTELEAAIKEPTAKALRRLHKLGYALETAESVQDKDSVTFADGNDPMHVQPTSAEMPGAKDPAGTSSPSTAPSNFAANSATGELPGPPSAAPGNAADASRTPGNGYAESATAQAVANTGPREMTSTTSNSGPSSSTAAVTAVANMSSTPAIKSTEVQAPAASAPAAPAKTLEGVRSEMEKADTGVEEFWAMDLNTPDFMRGKRKISFGRDGSK